MRVPKLRKNGDGRAFIEIPKSKGKRVYLGKYGTQEASAEYADWIKRYVSGFYNPPIESIGNLLLVEVIAKYNEHAKVYYSRDGQSTREFENMRATLRILAQTHGRIYATDFGVNELKQFFRHVSDKLDISRSYANKHLSRVKRFIRWSESEGFMPRGSWENSKVVQALRKNRTTLRETPKVTLVPIETVFATLPYMSVVVADMVQVQLYCGMRPQDVIHMRWKDITRKPPVWLYTPFKHKNEHRGQVLIKAIPGVAQRLLDRYEERPDDMPIFSPKDSIRLQQRSVHGNREVKVRDGVRDSYDNVTYGRAIRNAIEKANVAGKKIESWSPNQLRHTIGSMLRSHVSVDSSRVYLGHTDLDSTQIYAEIDQQVLIDTAKSVDQIFEMG